MMNYKKLGKWGVRISALGMGTDFPLQARFVAMKQDGQLSQATDVGARLVAYVLSDVFGNDPTPDLRQLSV